MTEHFADTRKTRGVKSEKWLHSVVKSLIQQGVTTLHLGSYGAFDCLATSILKKQK